MKAIVCEMCGSHDVLKNDGFYVCQACGTKYTAEEAKKLMIEGTVDVQGTVKVDNSDFVEKYLQNARRALAKEDWEEAEKYYNLVEQNAPNHIEALFFSSFCKAIASAICSSDSVQTVVQKYKVLINSVSVINDYFEETTEDKEKVLRMISDIIDRKAEVRYTRNDGSTFAYTTINQMNEVRAAFCTELKQIKAAHPDLTYLDELIAKNSEKKKGSFCYVATCVYGSYDCPEVWTLRRYRDNKLAETWYGRAFIHTYYTISPIIIKYFGHTAWFKKMWRGRLDRMVARLRAEGFESTPYEDKKW